MGKLAKGLIAAAIPIAVIVGIASCGHRTPVMTSATSESWVSYEWNITIPTTINTRINNQVSDELGYSITPQDVTGNNDTTWVVKKNSLAYLHHFTYEWSSLGNFRVVAHTMDWYVWDASAQASTTYFRTLLQEYKEYFLYAYASSNSECYEYGLPSMWVYNSSNVANGTSINYNYSSNRPFMTYAFPSSTQTLRIENEPLSNYLMTMVKQYATQAETPTYDNNGAYQQGKDQGYQEGYMDGLSDGKTDGYDEGLAQGRQEGFIEGQNSVTSESTAINNLFASLVSVPINVLNGLMPMAIWNTPIVSIMITFMLLAMLMWLIRKLLAR